MLEVMLAVVVLALAAVLTVLLRRKRPSSHAAHSRGVDVRGARAAKAAADQAVITRQGGQGMNQGGVGGGMGF